MTKQEIEQLLSRMTLEEKLAQMSQFTTRCFSTDAKTDVTGPAQDLQFSAATAAALGSTLGSGCAEDVIAIQKTHLGQDRNRIPLLFMRDVIHGWRTVYPIPLGMGATFDPELFRACAAMAAKEARAAGIHVTFSPMVDLARDCRWGRDMETTGEDPYLNCRMAEAAVRGYQGEDLSEEGKIACCVKHFAAYGAAESGRDYNTVELSEPTLRDEYLPAYRAAIDAGARMVMTSFNTLDGIPAVANRKLVKGILREEWGFDGTVITDWNSLWELVNHGCAAGGEDCARLALSATNDIVMESPSYIRHVGDLIAAGKIREEQVDDAVRRILTLKNELGLFEDPFRGASPKREKEYFLSSSHRELCRKAACESAVLLKNDGVLPLSEDVASVAVIGPFASCGMIGSWACEGRAEEAVSVAEGIRNVLGECRVTVAAGCGEGLTEEGDEAMLREAEAAAKSADAVVLCLGEPSSASGESNSRVDVCLSPAQKQLCRRVAKANPRTVVLLFCGRPLALSDVIGEAPAFAVMWQPGTEGGNAAADLLFGKTNFSGRLPMSFPRHVGQAPIYYNCLRTGRPEWRDEDSPKPYHTRYLECPISPLFPFGFGLSYTTFSLGEVTLSAAKMARGETVTAACRVKNTGDRFGVCTVQMYVHDKIASRARPVRELRGFCRVELSPGEEKSVRFPITEDALAFFTAEGERRAEEGEFEIFLSDSAVSGAPAVLTLM